MLKIKLKQLKYNLTNSITLFSRYTLQQKKTHCGIANVTGTIIEQTNERRERRKGQSRASVRIRRGREDFAPRDCWGLRRGSSSSPTKVRAKRSYSMIPRHFALGLTLCTAGKNNESLNRLPFKYDLILLHEWKPENEVHAKLLCHRFIRFKI